MTDNDDTGQPARLPSLEKGLRFRDRGRLGKLPEQASGPEWATMLQGTGYGSGAWWRHKINRAICQRDLKATTRGIIRRAEILRWLEQYEAMPDGWQAPTAPPSQDTTSLPSVIGTAESVQLPLVERAKRRLLSNESELWLQEIMELEFPALTSYEDRQRPERVNWQKSIEVAIQYGMLSGCQQQAAVQSQTHYYQDDRRGYFSGPREKVIHVVGYSDWRVPREPYRAWRATQTNPPTGSIIHLWLGTTVLSAISEPIELTLAAPMPDTGIRQIALVEAEDTALAVLRKKLKREPDFEEFWVHITEHDNTGTVAESTDDRLMWIGKDGRNCETAKSTMRNRLAAAKKRNPFGQEPIP